MPRRNVHNFGSGFARGFTPFVGSTADLISRLLIHRGAEQRQKDEEITRQFNEQTKQNSLLSTALQGGVPNTIDRSTGKVVPREGNKEFLAQIFSKMSPESYKAYEMVQPKKQDIFTVGGSAFPYKQEGDKLVPDMQNPIYTKLKEPEAITSSEVIPANKYTQDDGTKPFSQFPSHYRVEVRKTSKGGRQTGINVGVPFTWVSKDAEGGDKLSDFAIKQGDAYFKEIQKIRATIEGMDEAKMTVISYKDPITGIPMPLTREDISKDLALKQASYRQFMENNRSIGSSNYLTDVEKSVTKQGVETTNPNYQPTLWNSIWEDWQSQRKENGKIVVDKMTFQELYNSFRAEYGYDPMTKFGSGR